MMRQLERFAALRVIDERWKEHLYEMDLIKEGIGLRAYGQKDPLFEYKREGFETFREMLERIDQETVELIFRAQVMPRPQEPQAAPISQRAYHPSAPQMASVPQGQMAPGPPSPEVAPDPVQVRAARAGRPQPVRAGKKVGRNDPCPCGSGQKYKKCCGA